MNHSFFRRRIVDPIVRLLKQGVTPEKIALSIALGATLGVFPVIGSTTILCTAAALVLRLNLPAIQLVNFFVYPAQLALLIPFLQAGSYLFGGSGVTLTLSQIFQLLGADFWRGAAVLGGATVPAILLWTLASPLVAAALYFSLAPTLRRLAAAVKSSTPPGPLP
jgi:uncharacterized protein DUF2062